MSKQLVRSAATAILCLLIPAVGASAQQTRYPQASAAPSTAYSPAYTAPTPAASVVGTYRSDEFYPGPLTLTIGGMDAHGNLSGSISGWRSSWEGGETGDKWATWQRVFGKDARAFYRDGKINVVFPNGASYILDYRGTQLAGEFKADKESRPIIFLRSYGVASR